MALPYSPIRPRHTVTFSLTGCTQLRATAPRMAPLSLDVVPDKDRSVVLHLRPESSKR